MSDEIVSILEAKRVFEALSEGKRIDGRRFDEYRPVEIETNVISNANGSAKVRIGETELIAGLKAELVSPFPDMPDQGIISVSLEITALADPSHLTGPPSEKAIEIARIVDRGFREGNAIDLYKYAYIPGKSVLGFFVDIYVLSDDGNIIDAAGIATLAALKSARIPKFKVEGENVVPTGEYTTIELKTEPLPVTFYKIRDKLIVDATKTEEILSDSWLVISTGSDENIYAAQKGGFGTLKFDEVMYCIDRSIQIGKRLREKINEVIKNGKKN
ncbi:MAG: exosome complex protein Rrp42 [Candidatus Korarchaeota archaeon]